MSMTSVPMEIDGGEEVATLDRYLLRLGLTEDEKLQKVLSKLLPLVIGRLASPHEASRKKVLEMLTHINKRIRDHSEIKLPLTELLTLYTSPASTASTMVFSFAMVYLEMAFERASREDRLSVTPLLLLHLSLRPPKHQAMLLRCASLGIEPLGLERGALKEEKAEERFTFITNHKDRQLWLDFCQQTILYYPQTATEEGSTSPPPPPGLSQTQAANLMGTAVQSSLLQGERLANRKSAMLALNTALGLGGSELYPHWVLASTDSNERVRRLGEDLVKRRGGIVNLEETDLLNRLFGIYQGTPPTVSLPPPDKRLPASPPVKLRLLSCFTHSVQAANCFPATLQVIFDAVYGSDSSLRLKGAGMEFAATEAQLKPMAPLILSALTKLLDDTEEAEADVALTQLRAFTYQAIGQLAQRAPQLFKHLGGGLGLQDCPPGVGAELEGLLEENMGKPQEAARFCSLQWATRIFPPTHAPSRLLCMTACSDKQLEVREMGERALFPAEEREGGVEAPPLSSMLDCIARAKPAVISPAPLGEQTLLFPPATFAAILRFLKQCWQGGGGGYSDQYRCVLEHAMATEGTWALHATSAQGLLELGAADAEAVAHEYHPRLPWLRQHIAHSDALTREAMGKLLGICSQGLDASESAHLLQELGEAAKKHAGKGGRLEEALGAITACGYVLAQARTGTPPLPASALQLGVATVAQLNMQTESEVVAAAAGEALGHVGLRGALPFPPTSPPSEGVEGLVGRLVVLMGSKDVKVVERSVRAAGMLCYGDGGGKVAELVLEGLFKLARSTAEDVLFAVGEALALVWGGVQNLSADRILRTPFTSLTASYNFLAEDTTPPPEGTSSPSQGGGGGAEMEMEGGGGRRREMIRKKVIGELVVSGRKEERCAGAVWLLSITTYCGKEGELMEMLPEIQDAFSNLLGDPNELTQEMSSRGMSVVYEMGDPKTRDLLVQALVGTLSGAARKKRAVKISDDSEVLQEGTLGETPVGGGASTYKELCTLATDLGQPDLMYRFMDLANYQSALNSRRGAAFGFAKIAKQAGEALKPHLGVLVPKLLRLQYDPAKALQEAMGGIWRALVAEPKKTIQEYWVEIMEELLKEAGSRMWRSRESSCLALVDLLSSRRFEEASPFLHRLWLMAFRVADDIKESVRAAGEKLCRSLSSLSIRLCDPSLTPPLQAQQACQICLPILLQGGVLSSVAGVRKVALGCITKLVKSAGGALKGGGEGGGGKKGAMLADIMGAMLEALSSLEDQNLSYAEMHAERVGISSDKLESVRLSIATSSPMWETLDSCLKQVESEGLEEVVPRLVAVIRTGVGLNTRVGVARLTTLLVQRRGGGSADVKPYAPTLLKALMVAIESEKSSAARKAFAAASAEVAKAGGETRVEKLSLDALGLYGGGGGEGSGKLCGALILREIARNASEQVAGYSSQLLPMVFIGRYDADATSASLMEEVWQELSGSGRAAVSLHLKEITALICEGMKSSSWPRKKQSCKAVGAVAETVGADMPEAEAAEMSAALMEELPGRLWDGKESVLQAIGELCTHSGGVVQRGEHGIVTAVLGAAQRKKVMFREAALKCLEKVLTAFKGVDLLPQLAPLLSAITANIDHPPPPPAPTGSATAVEEKDEEEVPRMPVGPTLDCIAAAVGGGGGMRVGEEGRKYGGAVVRILEHHLGVHSSWTEHLSAIKATRAVVKAMEGTQQGPQGDEAEVWLQKLSRGLVGCVEDLKHSQVRIAALECLEDIVKSPFGKRALSGDVAQETKTKLGFASSSDKNTVVRALATSVSEHLNEVEMGEGSI